jgi:hypothetical protein
MGLDGLQQERGASFGRYLYPFVGHIFPDKVYVNRNTYKYCVCDRKTK